MLRPPLPNPGADFRKLLETEKPLVIPGVFNGISALSARDAGAKALYISGAGLSNGFLGVPDVALLGLTEFSSLARAICGVAGIPVISDADTGFGQGWNAMRTVIEMESAGLAGIHIEDQVSPKRCGHLDGKSVVAVDEMASKIKAAAYAKKSPDFVIIARTDARSVEGLDSAAGRAKAYLASGADAIFPEGLESAEEFEKFREKVDGPLLANMTEFGKTPLISAEEFGRLGYQMVIFPMTAFRVALKALDEAYEALIQEGSQKSLLEKMRTRKELYARLEYSNYEILDAEWAGKTE